MNSQLLLSLCVLSASTASASDHFVNAPESIQAAMNAAAPGDRILVGPGTYSEVIDFQGKQLEVIATGGPVFTILDGSGSNTTVVRVSSGEPAGTSLSGFTLTNGAGVPFPSTWGSDYYGGGVHVNEGSELSLSDCIITNNAWGTGTFAGGVYCGGEGSHVDLLRCVISNNRAWASGGGTLVDWHGTMTFEHCTIYGNSSDNFFGHQGGISMANFGTVVVKDSIAWANVGNDIGAFSAPYDQGTHADVSYSCVEGGYSGAFVQTGDPLFSDLNELTLSLRSPCVDTGDPSSTPDPDGTVSDMGARWSGWSGAPAPVEYCEPKLNSLGCEPVLSVAGDTSLGGADDLSVIVQNLRNNQFASIIWSYGHADVPFGGGTRCVGLPIHLTKPMHTGGTPYPGVDCTGSVDIPLSHGTLSSIGGPGTQVFMQVWSRDPGHPDGSNLGLTGGLCLTISS